MLIVGGPRLVGVFVLLAIGAATETIRIGADEEPAAFHTATNPRLRWPDSPAHFHVRYTLLDYFVPQARPSWTCAPGE
jgi:hypothetical protein